MFKFLKDNDTYRMKRKLTLSIDEDIIKNAKKSGVNISQLLEKTLKQRVGLASLSDTRLHHARIGEFSK